MKTIGIHGRRRVSLRKQRGVVLLIALIILVAMTLIAAAAHHQHWLLRYQTVL